VGFALATASTVFVLAQTLLRPLGPVMVVHSKADAGVGVVAAPRRPPSADGGIDGGESGVPPP
jgi:hypothetical protein